MATRTDLIHRVLRNLGALPQGQTPNAEESQSIDDLIDPTIASLQARNILGSIDNDFPPDESFLQLAACVAAAAAPEFGVEGMQAIWGLKERAEQDLEYIHDLTFRDLGLHRTLRSDYPITQRTTSNFTTG